MVGERSIYLSVADENVGLVGSERKRAKEKMTTYVLSFRVYSQSTIKALVQLRLQPYIGMWGTRLCATVDGINKEKLIAALELKGFIPQCSEIFENQAA